MKAADAALLASGGRVISRTRLSPEATVALAALTERYGSDRAAIEAALIAFNTVHPTLNRAILAPHVRGKCVDNTTGKDAHMSDKKADFQSLRSGVRICRDQLGASRTEEQIEFRRAATWPVVSDLLDAYDGAKACALECDSLIRHMDVGGDFNEFMGSKIRA